VPRGGAGVLAHALADRITSLGGTIRCVSEVTSVEIRDRRAVAVRTADGERYTARHAVVADVAAPHLYGRLVSPDELPQRTRSSMQSFEMDPGTVKVDWALDGPVPWREQPPYRPGTFHVADSVEQMSEALHQVSSQTIPARPFLLAGQMTTTDPTRSPAGTESLWAYTHVPQDVTQDAGDGRVRGVWDEDDCQRFADRMQDRIEQLAPGFGSQVIGRRVLGPREMEARDANLIGGGVNGGTAQLHQQLVFRPAPGLGRAETPVRGLYLGSASAHPGGGVHGAPGMNAARAAIAHVRARRATRGLLH
jgi:phytoene dehydrogenase-like protein